MVCLKNKLSFMKEKYTIIGLGGSVVIPSTGFNINFLKEFKKLLVSKIKQGEKFVIVVGGGSTCRTYQKAATEIIKLTDKELDWLGIHVTYLNAEFVRVLFGEHSYKEIIKDPSKKIKTNKPVLVASGWKPGWSTDYDVVKLAEVYGASEAINLSNIDYVYDKDPNKFKDAKKLEKLTWSEMEKLVGSKWSPGANVPFDPMATKLGKKLGLKVSFVDGRDIKKIKKALDGKQIEGTVVF